MKRRIFLLSLMLFTVTLLSGCAFFNWLFGFQDEEEIVEEVVAMSDEEIEERITSLGGRLIEEREEIGAFNVDTVIGGSGISITYAGGGNCQQFGWTQVIREWLDTQIVNDPTVLPDPPNESGKRERWRERITDDGFVVDGGADGTGLYHPSNTGRRFDDDPFMPDADIENNTQNPNARLYVLEAETCLKCLNPPSDYVACFKWYYVKIKSDDPREGSSRTYLITSGTPSNAPSDEFNEAVSNWGPN